MDEFSVSIKIHYKNVWFTAHERGFESMDCSDSEARDTIIARAANQITEFVKERDKTFQKKTKDNSKHAESAKFVAEILDAVCPKHPAPGVWTISLPTSCKTMGLLPTHGAHDPISVTTNFNKFICEGSINSKYLTPANALFRLLMVKKVRDAADKVSDGAKKFAAKLIAKRDKEIVEMARVLTLLDSINDFEPDIVRRRHFEGALVHRAYSIGEDLHMDFELDALAIGSWCSEHGSSCCRWRGKIPNPAQFLEVLGAHESLAAILTNPKFKPNEEISDARLAEFSL